MRLRQSKSKDRWNAGGNSFLSPSSIAGGVSPMVRDPVCGRELDEEDVLATTEYEEQTYYFCSQECHDQFLRDPQAYVHRQVV